MAQNKILYSAKLDKNMQRSAYFETNKRTVKSNIMLKFVTKAMDINLRGEADFTTTLEDPIQLLKRIERFMKKSADAEYDFLDFLEANQKFFAMKQGTTENLMHFKEQFFRQAEVLQEIYMALPGSEILQSRQKRMLLLLAPILLLKASSRMISLKQFLQQDSCATGIEREQLL
ncbi:unnamed protein product [Cylindrotheca closterium]|uniref:Uncharacterized protein n=1 Tax=Cylindrotheca closterium TaxID=2856 RepID=A0AAD2D0B3_9STRA|nr:unnamed protein product [Cylindrotheca closterium]